MVALVLGQSAGLTVVGIVLGLSGAAMLSHYLEGLLFGVTPLDPTTFALATALFAVVALVAAYGPVRRATGVDPLVALTRGVIERRAGPGCAVGRLPLL